ncbi:predicted protein [Nematostella vectensis]|uniref:Uncharacterized protein n=1 Tax=Nematostella vectensis TaxID=45351 RepID=A7S8R4_NEMVE|nr:predicted protein [Nematostella vectensis]|eukprot:XP_001631934.1 predicted protein [Nematostella vectensis]
MRLLALLALHFSIKIVFASTGLKFEGKRFPFAEFKPWDLSTNGSFELYFQTKRKNALLLYQDDGEGQDWIDVFLVEGRARIRITLGMCRSSTRIINGSFADEKWHLLKVKRNFTITTFSVDGFESELIECEITEDSPVKPKSSKTSLYLGGIPVLNGRGSWSNPYIFQENIRYVFSGCIARVKYSDGKSVMHSAHYKTSKGTTADCDGACTDDQCKNGGKCVDMLVRAECDCRGTGYVGQHCQLKKEILVNDSKEPNVTVGVTAHVRGLAPGLQPLPLTVIMVLLTCGMMLYNDYLPGSLGRML